MRLGDELQGNQCCPRRIYASYLKVNKMFECITIHAQSDSFWLPTRLVNEYLQKQELKLVRLFLTRFVNRNQPCYHPVFYWVWKGLYFLLLDFCRLWDLRRCEGWGTKVLALRLIQYLLMKLSYLNHRFYCYQDF